MFIPLDLNTPLVVGGLLNHWFNKNKNKKLANARNQRGILISSGFIAGAALFGVIGAVILFILMTWFPSYANILTIIDWSKISNGESIAEILAFFAFAVLICYFIWESFRAKEED